jgi:hypothetical protein
MLVHFGRLAGDVPVFWAARHRRLKHSLTIAAGTRLAVRLAHFQEH